MSARSLRLLGRTVAARSVFSQPICPTIRHIQSSVPDSSGFSGSDNAKNNTNLEILDLALTKVPDLGWSSTAVARAATELGYSSMAHGVAPDGAISLISHFMDRALDETAIEVDDQLHEFPDTSERLRFICTTRLKQTLPYVQRWPEAAAILAQPQNVPLAMRHLTNLSSQMWYLAGDKSTRIDWYTRRSALAAVYLSTELFMCEDRSPKHQDTWRFLKQRFENMDSAAYIGSKTVAFGEQFSRNLFNILASRGYVSH
ncbi:Ubiquinone biosynthesis protein coq9, mitochondrial [Coemansia sp. RSA 2530]|uniref:Ubiquinone biosynthesis protein n=1 Tax=Coemansia spiralis TaxID=417178 RepID=A0A9W8GA32_9FUNG|nr:Ubiquinone biosynthesis protein coq9, mitochondrial [Coemansia sp. RSA 2530]KAJ2678991.1 Ubiquinone biosynthesis protein coq9, mitochondrial [Coemansia spiralis]